ncbi:hypothetical protein ACJ41O_007681 [Fusarium nematophilum]
MPSYYSLPPEIQSMILHSLASQSTNLAPFTAVNKHWQTFFEAKTLRSLILHQDDLAHFDSVVQDPRRRSQVKHLWLRIELPAYPVLKIKEEEKRSVLWQADRTFTTSIFSLWDVLSRWEGGGLTLELSAHSPSDTGEYRRDDFIRDEVALYQEYLASGSTAQYRSSGDVHAPYLKLYDDLVKNFVPTEALSKWWARTVNDLLGWKPLAFNFSEEEEDLSYVNEDDTPQLPEVTAVTGLLIRRQQFRGVYPDALGKMTASLPRVSAINVERWLCADAKDEQGWCREANVTFGMDLPPSVKTLSLYGDRSSIFQSWEPSAVKSINFAKSLRRYGGNLENISVSFLIDARDFFKPFWPANSDRSMRSLPNWENLETLSLTSQILVSGSQADTNKLLCAAARAVKKMRRLRLLELWNGGEGTAAVFRYRVEDTVTEVAWLSASSGRTLDSEVVRAWNETSLHHGREDFRPRTQGLEAAEIVSVGTVLRHLQLREQILHPVSGYRIAWEQPKPAESEDQRRKGVKGDTGLAGGYGFTRA